MGVSGSGKTTIGKLLATRMGWLFYDADDFHPVNNIEKMKAGTPLTDEDREPWLDAIHEFAGKKTETNSIVFACSALKEHYRQRLSENIEQYCKWVYLKGDFKTIQQRLQHRENHYMPPALLQSQFDALELPAHAIIVDIAQTPEQIVDQLVVQLS